MRKMPAPTRTPRSRRSRRASRSGAGRRQRWWARTEWWKEERRAHVIGQIGREEFDDFSTIGPTRSRAAQSLPGDLEGEARGREPYEPQPEVARIGVVIVGLDVADASVTVLELPLNDKIGVLVARQIEVHRRRGSRCRTRPRSTRRRTPRQIRIWREISWPMALIQCVQTDPMARAGAGVDSQFVRGLDRVELCSIFGVQLG